ncbi:MAG: Hsp70 family protein, partial [Myxococcota bacterium]|nr:Hsp70 family protein [Myxococcota bacterium]
DFGTTNSALAVAAPQGAARLLRFGAPEAPEGEDASGLGGGRSETFRSVLFFDRDDEGDEGVRVRAGPAALAARLASTSGEGRLVQSLKSFLASRLFSATRIFGRSWRLEDLIGELLGALRREAEAQLGVPVVEAVVGRPVRFVGARSEEDERLAEARLHASLVNAGFRRIVFAYEPLGAAHHYERALERDERILIGDFGGGTSDFSLLWVGPSWRAGARRGERLLACDGVGVAGDAFDAKLVRHLVAPRLGRGASFRSAFGRRLPVPAWIYAHLEQWHHVSFLRSRRTMQILLDLEREAEEPEKLTALRHVVERDLGFALYRATELAKRELSAREATRLRIADGPLEVDEPVEREAFEGWIDEELARIAACVDGLLERAGVGRREVDAVFLTGGSSFVPAVRRIFEERFGAERLRGGAELTSVASGLALRAREERVAAR